MKSLFQKVLNEFFNDVSSVEVSNFLNTVADYYNARSSYLDYYHFLDDAMEKFDAVTDPELFVLFENQLIAATKKQVSNKGVISFSNFQGFFEEAPSIKVGKKYV